jgi:division protein CdvB (Snf7/Vps24/ESCRT-III family)
LSIQSAKKLKPERNMQTSKMANEEPAGLLKSRLESLIRGSELKGQRLDNTQERFKERDKVIFSRLLDNCKKHDFARASVLANEIADFRKIYQKILDDKKILVLRVMRLRMLLENVEVLFKLYPEGATDRIEYLIREILSEPRQDLKIELNFEIEKKDSDKILKEAIGIAKAETRR